jgi:hypothetical protein
LIFAGNGKPFPAFLIYKMEGSDFMRNIKQINNKSSKLIIDSTPTSVIVGYDEQRNPIYNDVYYATINIANSVHKIGYCADDCSIQYPIYINGKGIYPGKTGMYE